MKYSKRIKPSHEREGIAELLSRLTDIPADIFSGGMTLEMRGRNELLLCGCREIAEYSESVIRIVQGKCMLCIGGRRLSMSSFTDGRITVTGEIDFLDFCGGECFGGKA
jgi:sporulation protein YqfC